MVQYSLWGNTVAVTWILFVFTLSKGCGSTNVGTKIVPTLFSYEKPRLVAAVPTALHTIPII